VAELCHHAHGHDERAARLLMERVLAFLDRVE
jgi:hypothetical protein